MSRKSFVIASPHVIYRANQLKIKSLKILKGLLPNDHKHINDLDDTAFSISNALDSKIANEILEHYNLSSSELREIEIFFYLFMNGFGPDNSSVNNNIDPFVLFTEIATTIEEYDNYTEFSVEQFRETPEASEEIPVPDAIIMTKWFIEKLILASLFLNKDQIPEEWNRIYDFVHGTIYFVPNKKERTRLIPSKHWKIPLFSLLIKEKKEVSFLATMPHLSYPNLKNSKIDSVTVEDLKTNLNSSIESYYHINKDELMERVKHLLCERLFNGQRPTTMEDIGELYDRLLNYKGATMWKIASQQFPDDEVVFIWNRLIMAQSLERVWNLELTIERVNDSIPNFKVTHHRMARDGDQLIPIIDAEIWTNDQLRDVLGHDWIYDQKLIYEDATDKILSPYIVKKVIEGLIEEYKKAYKIYMQELIIEENLEKYRSLCKIEFSNFQINDDDQLILEEFSPEEILRKINNKKKLAKQDSYEEFINSFELIDPLFEDLFEFIDDELEGSEWYF